MAQRILLTGATGFVGSTLARLLDGQGYELRCLIRPGKPPTNLAGIAFEAIEGDVCDEGLLREAVRGVDMVAHLAALVSFRAQDRALMQVVNVTATERLARAARRAGVARFLHMSSVAAVGCAKRPAELDEGAPYNFGPLDIPYCDTKRAAEDAVLAEVAQGLDAVIVNPSSMFGPGDRRKAESSLLSAVAYGQVPFCPPGGLCVADVRDVAAASLRALEEGRTGERYILGGENLTGRQLLAKVAGVLGKRPPRMTMPALVARGFAAAARLVERVKPLPPPMTAQLLRLAPYYHWYSSRKAEEELGFASLPIEIAIKATYDWMFDLDLLDASRVHGMGRT